MRHPIAIIANVLVAVGTIALAVLAVFGETVRSWFRKPKLVLSVVCEPPDCVSIPSERQIRYDRRRADTIYLRVLVKNNGNESATNVEVYAEKLSRLRADQNWDLLTQFPPMNLVWSNFGQMYFPRIAPDMGKHCDIAHIIDPAQRKYFEQENPRLDLSPSEVSMEFDLVTRPFNKSHIVGPGTYRVRVVVAATNVRPTIHTMEIRLAGPWHIDQELMLRDGVGIMLVE